MEALRLDDGHPSDASDLLNPKPKKLGAVAPTQPTQGK